MTHGASINVNSRSMRYTKAHVGIDWSIAFVKA